MDGDSHSAVMPLCTGVGPVGVGEAEIEDVLEVVEEVVSGGAGPFP